MSKAHGEITMLRRKKIYKEVIRRSDAIYLYIEYTIQNNIVHVVCTNSVMVAQLADSVVSFVS